MQTTGGRKVQSYNIHCLLYRHHRRSIKKVVTVSILLAFEKVALLSSARSFHTTTSTNLLLLPSSSSVGAFISQKRQKQQSYNIIRTVRKRHLYQKSTEEKTITENTFVTETKNNINNKHNTIMPSSPTFPAYHRLKRSSLTTSREEGNNGDHVLRKVPVLGALITAAIVPLWVTLFLPITILYQLTKHLILLVLPKNERTNNNKLDSGYTVDKRCILPHNERKYDIVVLGATGFTGKLAVRHLAKTYCYDKTSTGGTKEVVKWAIAGRNEVKLRQILHEVATELSIPNLVTDIDIIIVDTSIPCTMPALVEQTRVVATTAGPYTLYGNSVVEFCVKFGTHYVDITGEIDWIRNMIIQWQDKAKETGSIIIPFCGHDSIPWDVSTAKLQEILKKECNDELQSVQFWDEAIGGAPGGTLATVFTFVEGNAMKAPKVDIDPYLRIPSNDNHNAIQKSPYNCISKNPLMIEKSSSPWESIELYSTNSRRWTIPFVMAEVNYNVVRWSHALRQQGSKLITYKESMVTPDFATAFISYVGLLILGSLLFNPLTAFLLKKYVFPKAGEGPSMDDMLNKHFLSVYGEGIGVNGNVVESIFYLSLDAGCLETSRMMIESGLCLALEADKIPVKQGGFYSPSVALGNDILLNRLVKTGTEYKSRVVPRSEISSNKK